MDNYIIKHWTERCKLYICESDSTVGLYNPRVCITLLLALSCKYKTKLILLLRFQQNVRINCQWRPRPHGDHPHCANGVVVYVKNTFAYTVWVTFTTWWSQLCFYKNKFTCSTTENKHTFTVQNTELGSTTWIETMNQTTSSTLIDCSSVSEAVKAETQFSTWVTTRSCLRDDAWWLTASRRPAVWWWSAVLRVSVQTRCPHEPCPDETVGQADDNVLSAVDQTPVMSHWSQAANNNIHTNEHLTQCLK